MARFVRFKNIMDEFYSKSGAYKVRNLQIRPNTFENRITSFAAAPEFIATATISGEIHIWSRDFFNHLGIIPNCTQDEKTRLHVCGRLLAATDKERSVVTLFSVEAPSFINRDCAFSVTALQTFPIPARVNRVHVRLSQPDENQPGRFLLAASNDVKISYLSPATSYWARSDSSFPKHQKHRNQTDSAAGEIATINADESVMIPKVNFAVLTTKHTAILWESETLILVYDVKGAIKHKLYSNSDSHAWRNEEDLMSMDSFGELLLVAERRKVAVWSLNTGALVQHIDLGQPEGLDLTQVQITGKCGRFHGALVVMMMEELEDDTAEDHISTDYRISSYTWKSDKDHSKFEIENGSLDLHQVPETTNDSFSADETAIYLPNFPDPIITVYDFIAPLFQAKI
ncbi:Oidioi.mRNA.OKI2018_I69.XSR.g15200.t1.cds [Oikopleura dioica]|uniref:Oidioi.mRNA.OKI2018_I69.XSR.g15200.t1.cds n=1 Tax=Oikopleura dioica TaxID=34765 RepID=A0ABN7SH66_OIKDI|nr:Oidioi.mRNA.OKI2018_I69.XSR.g15200.t1.cds [Oikopleura dioica]